MQSHRMKEKEKRGPKWTPTGVIARDCIVWVIVIVVWVVDVIVSRTMTSTTQTAMLWKEIGQSPFGLGGQQLTLRFKILHCD